MNYSLPLLAILALAPALPSSAQPQSDSKLIVVSTAQSALTLYVAGDGRLYELGYGRGDRSISAPKETPNRLDEFYPQFGDGFISEPSLQVTHADGNVSTDLMYVQHQTTTLDTNVSLTRIELKDPAYPFFVTLNLKTYRAEDMIEQWTEIRHEEPSALTLYRFASSAPVLHAKDYWLSQFHGDYAHEANLSEEHLTAGIKVLDSKIGVRAHQMRAPSVVLSLNGPAHEDSGEVYGGSLAWSGSFQLAFEVDWNNRLRAQCGINPFGSQYHLAPGKLFTTPAMLWTWSGQGKGQMSRNFHHWSQRYCIRDAAKPRPVLLNNWEATYFSFDEKRIVRLFDGARDLGVDLFLLDDGWFGNAHPRNDDHAGLGDWQVNSNKLPQGLSYLATQANQRGVKFGIWLEPEMVNPKSDLFEQHPDWPIQQPKRPLDPMPNRDQLVLDLTRPEIHDFTWKVIDNTFGPNPGINYVKWDCNRYVTQPGSTWLKPEEQSHLLIDYNFALYDIMAKMANKYPGVMAMLCSGGSGRIDFGALRYFHSFWPSDNTDPRDRVFIQWGFSHFFPAETIAAHVTRMHDRPIKFCLDVAMSDALGLDMDVAKLTPEMRQAVAAGVALYKQELRPVVQQGDLYRLESPYEHPRSALNYVSADRARAVLFVYQIGSGSATPVRPLGLDPQKRYQVREVNLPAGFVSQLPQNGTTFDGATLMREGLAPVCTKEFDSSVIELFEAKN